MNPRGLMVDHETVKQLDGTVDNVALLTRY
jgi:hypothetical protein